jgi:hypothetical protein
MLWLLGEVIDSFHTEGKAGTGLPLGNLTSQLLVNVYMNEFDHFVKRKLNAKYYIRYADDFVIMKNSKIELEALIPRVDRFLSEKLKLALHPDKVFIKTSLSGVDFLGWEHFPKYRVLRTSTRRRMLKRIKKYPTKEAIASYKGMLKHGSGWKIIQEIESIDTSP